MEKTRSLCRFLLLLALLLTVLTACGKEEEAGQKAAGIQAAFPVLPAADQAGGSQPEANGGHINGGVLLY